jgi:hypothetical protein
MNPYLVPDEDSEIDISELVHYILRHWVPVLLSGIIFACLLGGYKVSKALGQSKTAMIENETEAEEENAAYTAESELYSNAGMNLKTSAIGQNDYLSHSTLMKIDPYNVPTADAAIIITTRTKDKTIAPLLANEYRSELLEGEYLENLAESTGTETVPFLRELIDISAGSVTGNAMVNASDNGNGQSVIVSTGGQPAVNEAGQPAASDDSDSDSIDIARYEVRVTTVGKDQDQADAILDGVLEEAEKFGKTLADNYTFKTTVSDKRSYLTVDGDLLSRQQSFYYALYQTNDYKGKVKSYQDGLAKPETTADAAATGLASIDKKSLIKYAGLGFIIGIFLLALYYTFRYLRNDRLISYSDLCDRFILKDMGSYDKSSESVSMIMANLRNYAADVKRILLVGTAGDEVVKELQSVLKSQNPDGEILSGGDILTSSEARLRLAEADAAILIEKKGTSRYSEIARETEILNNADRPIIGIIIC